MHTTLMVMNEGGEIEMSYSQQFAEMFRDLTGRDSEERIAQKLDVATGTVRRMKKGGLPADETLAKLLAVYEVRDPQPWLDVVASARQAPDKLDLFAVALGWFDLNASEHFEIMQKVRRSVAGASGRNAQQSAA